MLFILSLFILLVACQDPFIDLVDEAQEALGKGDFEAAQALYEEALEVKDDADIVAIVQVLQSYAQLTDQISAEEWEKAAEIVETLIEDENVPYAIKKEVREQLAEIEVALTSDSEFNEQVKRIETFIHHENIREAEQALRQIKKDKLNESRRKKIISLEEQVETIEQEAVELEERELVKRKHDARERAATEKAEKMSRLRETYFQKAKDLRAEVAYLEEKEQPVSTNEVNDFLYRVYTMWDDLLNEIWDVLEEEMPASEFEALRIDQRKWIEEKEAKAASFTQGTIGTAEALISNWEYTEERIDYLINNYMK